MWISPLIGVCNRNHRVFVMHPCPAYPTELTCWSLNIFYLKLQFIFINSSVTIWRCALPWNQVACTTCSSNQDCYPMQCPGHTRDTPTLVWYTRTSYASTCQDPANQNYRLQRALHNFNTKLLFWKTYMIKMPWQVMQWKIKSKFGTLAHF